MSYEYSEDALVETATVHVLEEIGWEIQYAWKQETFGPSGLLGRENKSEVILKRYLRNALISLNPDLPENAYDQAIEQIGANRNIQNYRGRETISCSESARLARSRM